MKADRLEALLDRYPVSAAAFHAGPLCGVNDVPAQDGLGQLHLVRSGEVGVSHGGAEVLRITQPSLLLYPRPLAHRFLTDARGGAELVCAHLRFEGGAANPVVAALPDFVCLPLAGIAGLGQILELLFDEAFESRCGRQAMLNRLFETVLIQILRQLMEDGRTGLGMLSGLGHPRLRHALVAIHENPGHAWTLPDLARKANLSRSAFATLFRETLGCTPGEYLLRWRVALAQRALRQGRPLKHIAADVGYGSEAALSRAFKAQAGLSPRQWKQQA